MANKFIIDTDAGVDDAQAILLAFGHEESKIVAFTTVNGNVGVDKTTANVLKLLDLTNNDIPVFPGCASPLVNEPYHAAYVHGKDGLGDCGFPASKRKPEKMHAVKAFIELPEKYQEKLGLIAIGPLTNLAVALRLDPTLPQKYDSLTIMGGAIQGKGNTNITAEFNIFADPEAAHIVFECWPMVRVLSWETTLSYMFNSEMLDHFFTIDTPRAKFFHDSNQIILKFIREKLGFKALFAPDGLAVAAALEPDIVTKSENHRLEVELGGKLTRGLTSVDWFNFGEKPANAELILEINHERFIEMMENGLKKT